MLIHFNTQREIYKKQKIWLGKKQLKCSKQNTYCKYVLISLNVYKKPIDIHLGHTFTGMSVKSICHYKWQLLCTLFAQGVD